MTKPKLVDADAVISQTMQELHTAADQMESAAAVESFVTPEEPAAEIHARGAYAEATTLAEDAALTATTKAPAAVKGFEPALVPLINKYVSVSMIVETEQQHQRNRLNLIRNSILATIEGVQREAEERIAKIRIDAEQETAKLNAQLSDIDTALIHVESGVGSA